MRTVYRAAVAVLLVLSSLVGPVSAATSVGATIAQATAPQPATITGRVTAASGAGIGAASVTLDGPSRASATTDASGNFTFTVPPGTYTITVNKGGYQTGQNEIVVVPGTALTANVQLTESSLQNLQTIGRTSGSVSSNSATFNVSSSANSTLPVALVQERDVPELARVISTLPGVITTTNSSSVTNNFRIRGTTAEGKTQLDGHPVSSGTTGTFVASFLDSGLIGGVDVLKGAGLNGPTAGESAVGTVNIRTVDFAPKNTGYFQGGIDQYGGSFYTLLANFSVGKFSFVLGESGSGYRGNNYGVQADGLATAPSTAGPSVPDTYTYSSPFLTNNLAAYSADYSSTQTLNSQLGKIRYKFSDATSLSAEFVGFQGQYNPEGGSYGQFDGYALIPQCVNAKVAASGTACTTTSIYNAYYLQNQVGTVQPLYTFFPATYVQQNNPNFSAEFKTTFKNDTIFFRPYAATINRIVNENGLNSVYGNGSSQAATGSYAITNLANCQVNFVAPTATASAKGPCYSSSEGPGAAAYVVTNTGVQTAFPTTTTAAFSCSPTPPYTCFTAPTQQNNSGVWGFGNINTSIEVDKLAGYTFTYVHPVAQNIYNFSIDHYYDDTQSYQGDQSALAPGCTFTQATPTATPTNPLDPGYQPGCTLIGSGGTVAYHVTPVLIPETFSSITSYSLTAQFQLLPTLEFDFGNYLTTFKINGQQESPAYLASFVAAQQAISPTYAVNTSYAPVVLSGTTDQATHYDPHFGFVLRPSRDLAVRATGGSSVSIPYASQVSGLASVTYNASGYQATQPNPSLKAEEVVALGLGTDYRVSSGFARGTVFSMDLFNNVIHNAWITQSTVITPPAGFPANVPYTQMATFNGPQEISKGVEFYMANLPSIGIGYSLSTTFDRTYYWDLPPSFTLNSAQYTYNNAQAYGQPYSKGYLNLQYASVRNSLLRLGVDYEGPGNSANYLPYFQFDMGARVGFANKIELLGAVENLTNLTFGAPYGHGIINQATNPVAQTLSSAGAITYTAGPLRGIAAPLPRTIRISLAKRF